MSNPSSPVRPEDRGFAPRRPWAALIAVATVVVIFAALFAWRTWRNAGSVPPERPPVAVAAMVVAPMAMPVSLKAVGSLSAVREVLLSPETAGRVVAIGFEAGAKVEAGAKLVQLYDAPERADRAAALARANLARTQLERATTLVPTGAESRAMLDQRSAERDQALAEVQQLDARIDQKQIRAPFAGTLGIRLINLGQYLNPGDAIATLSDSSELFVNFSVPQQHLPQLREGGTVRVTTDAFPGRTFTARVNAVESRVSRDTRNIAVQALLSNPDGALRPGMHVAAELELPPEENVLVVPPTAIQATAMGDSVIVVRGPEAKTRGQADHVRVEVGRRSGEKVIVTRGLEVGDVVVTEGQLRVPPGAQVQVTQLQPGEE